MKWRANANFADELTVYIREDQIVGCVHIDIENVV
jgi:hypothetical protein